MKVPQPELFEPTTDADQRHLADILRSETTGGLLMIASAALALLLANVVPHVYEAVLHTQLGPLTVHQWVADGLLTIFFFVAGLELKREFVEGSLRRPASAMVPIIAAACGMAIPALLYVLVNTVMPGGHLHGWAIPMATDIAFALAVLAIVGSQLPPAIRSFLLTLAIVDDLGAIIVIAIFFATDLNWAWLAGSVVLIAIWGVLQHIKQRSLWLMVPLFLAAWWCMLQSGVHATIAGVALGLLVRTKLEEDDDTLDVWQHHLQPWSAGLVIPLFAIVSAGVHLSPAALRAIVTNPVPLGIMLGLVVGKLVGVFGGSMLTARLAGARTPEVKALDVAGTAQLAGIGFTVSLLMVELAFKGQPDLLAEGKAAVLIASVASALIGGLILRRRNAHHAALTDA